MKPWRPFTLAALLALFAGSGGLVNAQTPPPVAKTNVTTATTPTTTIAAAEDIRDIRPPMHIPYGWLWAVYVAGGLGLAGLAFAAWRWQQRQARAHRKPLYELALEQLEAARALMEPDQAYPFSIAVSEIVRTYIEQRFQARAAHRTTEEFLHDLLSEQHALLTAHQPLLADFLGHCDLAKFARWHLSVPQMEAMHQSACTFVIETGKPTAPAVAEPAVADPQPLLREGSKP